ncbi:MAG: thioredoxin-disulfide reductase [Deltaproteobacteria bacterium]|nr:thioredoxin-disulfide reductase [Deltaproteobacteria bacterium]
MRNIIILGSGPAGLTAGLYASRADLSPLIMHGPQPGGQLTTTTEVENFPGFPGGVMGPQLMEDMQKQVVKFGAEIVQGLVTKVELSKQPFVVSFDGGSVLAKALIVATGASARLLGLPRESELMGYGLSTCATCDGAFFRNKEIVVIGGGDSACEEALFLTRFGRRVRLVHRRDELRASKIMADRVLAHPKIEVLWNKKPVELIGERKGGITGLVVECAQTLEKQTVECDAIFYAIGHVPNTALFKGALDMDSNGYLLTRADSTLTNIDGVFAAGDVRDHVFRQAITAAGNGCMAALEAQAFLAR